MLADPEVTLHTLDGFFDHTLNQTIAGKQNISPAFRDYFTERSIGKFRLQTVTLAPFGPVATRRQDKLNDNGKHRKGLQAFVHSLPCFARIRPPPHTIIAGKSDRRQHSR